MNNQNNEFVTLQEAAIILRVNPRHVKAMILSGKIRAKNINATGSQRKIYRVLKSDLTAMDEFVS